uniref:Uncharacterized protein n=1 Tax=Arundo donax TaxID=35708 RepID=A0A0A9CCX3_ARUDO
MILLLNELNRYSGLLNELYIAAVAELVEFTNGRVPKTL